MKLSEQLRQQACVHEMKAASLNFVATLAEVAEATALAMRELAPAIHEITSAWNEALQITDGPEVPFDSASVTTKRPVRRMRRFNSEGGIQN